ncbi:MAG: hypothetical protein IPL75_22285 [Acidobacteria bacterium]|nr:hypothetical protein [Acidobacteriota bacterium]
MHRRLCGRVITTVISVIAVVAGAAACAPSVSDHDNRIFSLPASVKLSAVDLSSAYAADAGAADGRYRGRVIEISGVIRSLRPDTTAVTMAGAEAGPVIEASIHDDVAAQVLKGVADGQRLTLKCFCEGLDQHVRLKSCVAPDPVR